MIHERERSCAKSHRVASRYSSSVGIPDVKAESILHLSALVLFLLRDLSSWGSPSQESWGVFLLSVVLVVGKYGSSHSHLRRGEFSLYCNLLRTLLSCLSTVFTFMESCLSLQISHQGKRECMNMKIFETI